MRTASLPPPTHHSPFQPFQQCNDIQYPFGKEEEQKQRKNAKDQRPKNLPVPKNTQNSGSTHAGVAVVLVCVQGLKISPSHAMAAVAAAFQHCLHTPLPLPAIPLLSAPILSRWKLAHEASRTIGAEASRSPSGIARECRVQGGIGRGEQERSPSLLAHFFI